MLSRLVAVGLAGLLGTGVLTTPISAQEPIRGLSPFPGPETQGVVPKDEIAPLTESAYTAAAVMATIVALPHRMGWCLLSDGLGFVVGAVLRVPVTVVTAGDRFGAGERLEGVGAAMVEGGCGDSLLVTPQDLKR